MDRFEITFPDTAFDKWDELHALVQSAFAYMEGRIDPPSSLAQMSAADFAEKAQSELLLTAQSEGRLAGAAMVRLDPDKAYVGKLAVAPDFRGRGLGSRMLAAIEVFAKQRGIPLLELQTRIELIENHARFAAWGFVKVAETAHPGIDRPTSITMQKRVSL